LADLDFDFGFTLVDENDLESVKNINEKKDAHIEFLDKQVSEIYEMILPLLTNLEKNPELDYIKWPGKDRQKKIKEFRLQLDDIAGRQFSDISVDD